MATPAGIKPIYVSNKQKEKYGLTDGITHKLFKKNESLEEAQTMGFYSLFHEIKAELQRYDGTEILLVADPAAKYGENFYFCLSEEAKATELQRFTEGGATAAGTDGVPLDDEEAKRLAAEAEERVKAEEEAALDLVIVHEAPKDVRPYVSETADETSEDVKRLSVHRSRPLLTVKLQRRRYAFGATCSFNDREAEAAGAEFRPRKEPSYELKRRELSVGLQGCPSALSGRVHSSTQTTYFPQVHAALQCDMETETIQLSRTAPLAAALSGSMSTLSSVAAATHTSSGSRSRARTSSGVGIGTDMDDDLWAASGKMDAPTLRAMLADTIAAASTLESGTLVTAESLINQLGPSGMGMTMGGGRASIRMSTVGGFASGTSGGGGVGGSGPNKGGPTTPMERLVDFLFRALPQCEFALGQNETLNIFRNELTLLADEDVVVMGNSEAKHIREERQFMDLELSNNKLITSVEWHPNSPAWLAVAAMPRLSFDQRMAESAIPRVSFILLYTLAEFSNQLILEAPSDVTCMHWNASNPNLLAVGTVQGQVAVFDLADAHEAISLRRKAAASSSVGEHAADEVAPEEEYAGANDGTAKALRLKPKLVSSVEAGYNRGVVGIRWLPISYHLNHRNSFGEDRDGEACQFISASSDGGVAVWDTRYKERQRGRRRHSASEAVATSSGALSSALVPGAAAANVPAPPPEVPWTPQYRINVRFGTGPVNITSFIFNEKVPSEPLICGTEEGRIVVVDWAPHGEGTGSDVWLRAGEPPLPSSGASGAGGGGVVPASPRPSDAAPPPKALLTAAAGGGGADDGEGGGGGGGAAMRVLWVAQDGERPTLGMQRSPFLSDVYLVVTDFSFSIWKAGFRSPMFTSSPSSAALSAGRWSPSRPAVLFIGRSDGVLEVWDLLDSTIKPVVSLSLMSVPVTFMEFRLVNTPGAGGASMVGLTDRSVATTAAAVAGPTHVKQLLAVGDAKGSLHVLDIPLPLRKGLPNEEALLHSYMEREVARVGYVAQRSSHHDTEKARRDTEAAREAAAKESYAIRIDLELQAAVSAMSEKDPAAAKTFDVAALERQRHKEALVAAEAKYQALQKAIMDELGVKWEDVSLVLPPSTSAGVSGGKGGEESRTGTAFTDSSVHFDLSLPPGTRGGGVPPTGGNAAAMVSKRGISGSGAAAAKTISTGTGKATTQAASSSASGSTVGVRKAPSLQVRLGGVEESKRGK